MPPQIRLRRGLKVLFVDEHELTQALSMKALVLALIDEIPPGQQRAFFEHAATIQRSLDAADDEDGMVIDVPS